MVITHIKIKISIKAYEVLDILTLKYGKLAQFTNIKPNNINEIGWIQIWYEWSDKENK